MAGGLLSIGGNRSAGLLGGGLRPMANVGATDDALRRHREQEAARMAREAASQPQGGLLGGNAPAAPQRERVSGWRLFDRVLGGQTISDGLDAERARLSAEAMRPQQMAIAAENERIARELGPQALLAYRLNGEKLGGELAEGFGTDVLAAGSGLFSGGRRVAEQARTVESGDEILRVGSDGVAPLYTRTAPSIAEQNDRYKVEQDARQFDSRLALDRDKLAVDAQVGLGGLEIDQQELGLKRDEVSREEQDRQRAELAASDEAKATADSMAMALTRAREFVGSAGAYQFLNPLNRQGRANLEAQLDTLKGNLTLDKLMEMKANSPNGASGMGALSESEGRLLASTVASLSADMTPEELGRSFTIIDALVAKMREPAPAQGGVSREAAIAEARRRGLIP